METKQVESVVLNAILSEIGTRLDGAVDFWTVVCLTRTNPYRREFLRRNLEELRCLVSVARIFCRPATHEISSIGQRMTASWEKLRDAFQPLEEFEATSLEDIQTATSDLAEVYREWRQLLRQAGASMNLPVDCWTERTPEQERCFSAVLRGLFDQFRSARGRQPLETAPCESAAS